MRMGQYYNLRVNVEVILDYSVAFRGKHLQAGIGILRRWHLMRMLEHLVIILG
jgi:hypothetical protein